MATRSRIGYINENGVVLSSYCHWDGYPSWVGKILLENYNSYELIKELISLGNISSLNKKIYPTSNKHTFDNPEEGVTVFYGRDCGEEYEECIPSSESIFYSELGEEYNYLFKDGCWYCDEETLTEEMTKED